MEMMVGKTRLTLIKGDITEQAVEAVVNAANSSLLGGSGVDGAIHRAGGPQILAECREIRARQGGCPTGEAVITTGGNLPAGYVIHTVGPIWTGGNSNEPELLRRAYFNSLSLASRRGIRSVAFPSISTGAYGYPIRPAAEIALRTVLEYLDDQDFAEVRFVLFSDRDLGIYEEVLQGIMADQILQ